MNSQRISSSELEVFKHLVWDFYKENKRAMPWRETTDPYAILVSEIMLQQTQVPRVLKKFPEFIKKFPTVKSLARATIPDVLALWQGLGYNRRALALKRAAEHIINERASAFPNLYSELIELPGVGDATAHAILAYAFNKPAVFIETNIRTVFIHHFFAKSLNVSDEHILPLVQQTLDYKNPREWYWALMDYGTYLKKNFGNPNVKSKRYTKQSPFEGSYRQKRSNLLKLFLNKKNLTLNEICNELNFSKSITHDLLSDLVNEQFIEEQRGTFSLMAH
jgi:A/G-specific adenine glycosylase